MIIDKVKIMIKCHANVIVKEAEKEETKRRQRGREKGDKEETKKQINRERRGRERGDEEAEKDRLRKEEGERFTERQRQRDRCTLRMLKGS